MKIMKILLISYGIILFVLLTSCAETTAPDAESIVRIRSEMFQGMIQSINIDKKNPLFQKSVVDSVKISKLRILISEIVLPIMCLSKNRRTVSTSGSSGMRKV